MIVLLRSMIGDYEDMRPFAAIDLGSVMVMPFTADRHLTDRYVSWLNDPVVVRYSEQRHHTHDLRSCRDYFQDMNNSNGLFLAIETAATGHIGNVSVAIDGPNRSADVSIMIGERRAWGQGHAAKVWSAITDYLLNDIVRRVTAGTMSVNEPMLAIMRKSGMEIDAVRPRHFIWEGQEVDLVMGARWAT